MSKFGELINSEKPVLIHFSANHIPECEEVQNALQNVAEEMENKVTIIKIDILKNKELAEALRIRVAPTLMLYKDGAMVWRQSNAVNKETLLIVAKAYS